MTVIFPAKAHVAVSEVDQTIVRNRHPMRVAAKVLKNLLGAAEGGLGVNHPLGLPDRRQIPGKRSRGRKCSQAIEEAKFAGVKRTLQLCQEQATEEPREHPHRQEETGAAGDPALAVGTQAAAGNHAVQMRVDASGSAPRYAAKR